MRAGADAARARARALEARLYRRQGTLEKVEEVAERLRISELQRAVDDAERKIGRLKARMGRAGGRRAGWYGVAARTAEVLAAVGTGSGRVALQVAARRTDLLAMLREDTTSLLRMGTNWSLTSSYLTRAEALLPHAPAIYARAAQLERHAVPIQLILDEHFDYLEPHVRRATLRAIRRAIRRQFSDGTSPPQLDAILARFDDIEPHMSYILRNVDSLAPHTGTLLKHLDPLLLYAGSTEEDVEVAEELLEYLPFILPRLDTLGPHLPLLRPHLRVILPHLPTLYKFADRFVPHVAVSANADVVLWYFGWALRIPLLPYVIAIPGVPRAISWLARRLPRRPVRGRTADYACDWEGCSIEDRYRAASAYRANALRWYAERPSGTLRDDVQKAVQLAVGR